MKTKRTWSVLLIVLITLMLIPQFSAFAMDPAGEDPAGNNQTQILETEEDAVFQDLQENQESNMPSEDAYPKTEPETAVDTDMETAKAPEEAAAEDVESGPDPAAAEESQKLDPADSEEFRDPVSPVAGESAEPVSTVKGKKPEPVPGDVSLSSEKEKSAISVQDVAEDTSLLRAGESGADASAHFHTTITTNKEIYTSGETVQVSIRYTIDQDTIRPGDYVIVTIPENIASKASFSVSRQHFSSVEELGGGQYKLIFGENAATGLSGSMTARVTTSAETTTAGTITAGDGEKTITVTGGGSGETGTGVFEDEAIMKDGLGNEGMSYGGYDYSGGEPAQIGLFDSSVDQDFVYRLYINRKNVSMTNVTVRDTLPDGMYFAGGTGYVACYKIDASSMSRTDEPVPGAAVQVHGQTLTVHLGDIDFPVEIEYTVHVPAQTSVYLRNISEVTYTQDGMTYQERRDYIAQGNDFSASNGVKSVDKTLISDDPSDQWVTYTIRFWNENRFAAGEIVLTDDLDDHVRFLYADDNEYFALTVDEEDPSILHITNVKDIPASTEVYETFVCDFGDVPIGYTVFNTTGGNTTRTKKIRASLQLVAEKTVNGEQPAAEETFRFRLLDEDRRTLQTAASDAEGKAAFATLQFGTEDLGKTFHYYVSEVVPEGDEAYDYDRTEYAVTAAVGTEAGEDGVVPVSVSISRGEETVEALIFNNVKREPEKTEETPEPTKPEETPEPIKPVETPEPTPVPTKPVTPEETPTPSKAVKQQETPAPSNVVKPEGTPTPQYGTSAGAVPVSYGAADHPKTYDSSHLKRWTALLCLSLCGLAIIMKIRKKRSS